MKRCALTKGTSDGTFCRTSSNAIVALFATLVWRAKGHSLWLKVGDRHPRPEMDRRSITLVSTRTRRTRCRCTRTLVNAHTRRLHTHARERTHATAAHAQEMLPRTHTRRQGNARLRMRTRDDHARTRHVDAQARS